MDVGYGPWAVQPISDSLHRTQYLGSSHTSFKHNVNLKVINISNLFHLFSRKAMICPSTHSAETFNAVIPFWDIQGSGMQGSKSYCLRILVYLMQNIKIRLWQCNGMESVTNLSHDNGKDILELKMGVKEVCICIQNVACRTVGSMMWQFQMVPHSLP